MEKLYVFADFDWLSKPLLVGELTYEFLRGNDSYGFRFDNGWLQKYGSLFLSDDINNYPGQQYAKPDRDIFGCFADALPDRWGRTLLNRREQIIATEEKRPAKRLSSYDYLVGIDDYSRMGGFRFRKHLDGQFICTDNNLPIPPVTSIKDLIVASQEIEKDEEKNIFPEKKWIQQLVHPGTSLGGARPKAGVVDEQNTLFVAKFPSRKDDYDVAMWEHLCQILARQAGIWTAETSVIGIGGEKYHTLLSKRFDRTANGRRIHFASAMTLLGLKDGCNAGSGNGYLDIVDFIIRNCCDVDVNLRELYRRVAFNICVGNSDDHFRNHGFLLTSRGWTLSPAYDMNPTNNEFQSILINASSNKADLNLLFESSDDYMIPQKDAETIICEVVNAVCNWKTVATRLGIAKRECSLFEDRMCSCKVSSPEIALLKKVTKNENKRNRVR